MTAVNTRRATQEVDKPRTGSTSHVVGVRLFPGELRALDQLAQRSDPPMPRSTLAVSLIIEALIIEGLLPEDYAERQ